MPAKETGLKIEWEKVSRTRTQLMARYRGTLVHCHAFDLSNATSRTRFAEQIVAKVKTRCGATLAIEDAEKELLERAEEVAALPRDEAAMPPEYHVVDDEDPERCGLHRDGPDGPIQLTNFTLDIQEDVMVVDDVQSHRNFMGRITLHGVTSEFAIPSDEYGNGDRLKAAIFAAAGPKARIICKPEELCRAVSAVSAPTRRTRTMNYGWNEDGTAYLTPSVRIDAAGVHPTTEDEIRVDLAGEQCARWLDMKGLPASELAGLKEHFEDDFLGLHQRQVMFLLVATAALAVLFRFIQGMNRPATWLTGLTGEGKSFLGRVLGNLFGDFPIQDGSRVGSWSSTVGFLQRQGYFFKDALYLIDDYKPEVVIRQQADVIRLLQNYGDSSARGRLKSDATTNVSREIRGILLSTGEDVPEHTASSLARNVIVRATAHPKQIERGKACLERLGDYRGLMAHFIHDLIASGRPPRFVARVAQLVTFYHEPIAGQQNALRIAGNLALLGAACEEFMRFMDAPALTIATGRFIEDDLPAIRDEMLTTVKEEQASQIFLEILGALITHGEVKVAGWIPPHAMGKGLDYKPTVGRQLGPPGASTGVFEIATALALAAVQSSLRKQGRPPLPATYGTLIKQLLEDGKLLGRDNQPLDPGVPGDHTWDARIDGPTKKVFRILAEQLIGEATEGDHDARRGR